MSHLLKEISGEGKEMHCSALVRETKGLYQVVAEATKHTHLALHDDALKMVISRGLF